MANEYSISQVIQIGRLSQVLANISNLKNALFKGQTLDQRWPETIYQVWKPLSIRYAANPNDTTLRQVAEWLIQLCGPLVQIAERTITGISAGLATITGPSSQSVNVGQNAMFSLTIASQTPYTITWFANGVLIPGANGLSYTVTNAQLNQTGTKYFAVVTNAAGPVQSNTVTLTVTASLVAYYYFGSVDYSTILQGGTDSVPYLGTFPITSGQPLSFTWPSGAADNQYIVVKYPATESTKTTFSNAPFNNGNIPGIAFSSIVVIGAWKYIFNKSGNGFSQNVSAPLIFS